MKRADWGRVHVEDLRLSIRAYNILKHSKIDTVDYLLYMTQNELLALKNCGQKTMEEILDHVKIVTGIFLIEGNSIHVLAEQFFDFIKNNDLTFFFDFTHNYHEGLPLKQLLAAGKLEKNYNKTYEGQEKARALCLFWRKWRKHRACDFEKVIVKDISL